MATPLFLPMRSMGRGTIRRMVEGSSGLRSIAAVEGLPYPSTALRAVPLPTFGREDCA
jgi:hypothetical protein